MIVVGNTIAGAISGENAIGSAEGFKISGKRTENDKWLFCHFDVR